MKRFLLGFFVILTFFANDCNAQQWDNYRDRLWDPNVSITTTNLPIVFINVDGRMILRNDYILGRMKVIHNGDGQVNYGDTITHPNQLVDYEGWIGLKYRGNSSFDSSDKKPYAIQTLKDAVLSADGGSKDKVKILGMGKDNKWAMIAPWADRSFIRDVLTFDMARPWFDFVPHTRLCEVILDGTYYGVFVLCERVSKGKHRLNLNDPGSDDGDLSGDFLVEVDRNDQLSFHSPYRPWRNSSGQEFRDKDIYYQYKFPEEDDFPELPAGTRSAIDAEVLGMEDAFRLPNYTDESEGYPSKIDVTSWIDFQLSQEFAFNIDGYRLSTPLYKYSRTRAQKEGLDHRWKMSLWDFNYAYGNANYNNGTSYDLWLYDFNSRNPGDGYQIPFYWYKLMADPNYVEKLEARWTEYRRSNYSNAAIEATIDSLTTMITSGGAYDRNQQAWQTMGRWGIGPNAYVFHSYDEEISYMKRWLQNRVAWLDKAMHLPVQKRLSQPVAVRHGDWRDDLVAEKNDASSITSEIYTRYTLYSTDLYEDGGLPADGLVTSGYYGVKYHLAPYDENNCVFLDYKDEQVDVFFDNPVRTSELFVLATRVGTATNPPSFAAKIYYTDGTQSSDWDRHDLNEWIQGTPDGTEAITGLGRLRTTFASSPAGFKCTLWDVIFNTDATKEISGIRLRVRDDSKIAVFGFSAGMGIDTSIEDVRPDYNSGSGNDGASGIYNANGMKMNDLQPGLNIIRYRDGSTRKILMK